MKSIVFAVLALSTLSVSAHAGAGKRPDPSRYANPKNGFVGTVSPRDSILLGISANCKLGDILIRDKEGYLVRCLSLRRISYIPGCAHDHRPSNIRDFYNQLAQAVKNDLPKGTHQWHDVRKPIEDSFRYRTHPDYAPSNLVSTLSHGYWYMPAPYEIMGGVGWKDLVDGKVKKLNRAEVISFYGDFIVELDPDVTNCLLLQDVRKYPEIYGIKLKENEVMAGFVTQVAFGKMAMLEVKNITLTEKSSGDHLSFSGYGAQFATKGQLRAGAPNDEEYFKTKVVPSEYIIQLQDALLNRLFHAEGLVPVLMKVTPFSK